MIDFEKLIANHLEQPSYPKTIGRYYPSSIGSCMRKYWYSYKYPMELDPKVRKIFHIGNVLHDFVVEVLRSDKNPNIKLVAEELPIKIKHNDFLVSGRIDNIIIVEDHSSNNVKVLLIEVKSIQDIQYQQKPAKAHKMQLQLYMHASKIHNGALLYIDKKRLDTKLFQIAYDKEEAERILERFAKFHSMLTKNQVPPAEAKKRKEEMWLCGYCEYSDKCDKYDKENPTQ